MQRKLYILLALIAVFALSLTACGGATETPTEEPMEEVPVEEPEEEPMEEASEEEPMEMPEAILPMVDPLTVEGDVVSAGSSTVFPLAERMAERFQDEGYAGNVTIDSIG
ncbi:MAG: hypothetical protein JXB38_17170, partial [Anaerolineales bacterium]|nr:hypothetical protein [Anaerolineales bacterium]